jgi:two-component system, sensor histidine kinase YesM
MAEEKRSEQVVELVGALSRFFRISLSKGKDWITIGEEIQHIESYLAIQKIRYQDILDYSISMPEEGLSGHMLKLMLQPLVENALYHGIKNKRGGGMIRISGRMLDDQHLRIEVADNGIGIPPDRLALIQALLEGKEKHVLLGETGYGLNNVNQRLWLYYGQAYGLSIASEYRVGTTVSLVIPQRLRERRKSRRFELASREANPPAGGPAAPRT